MRGDLCRPEWHGGSRVEDLGSNRTGPFEEQPWLRNRGSPGACSPRGLAIVLPMRYPLRAAISVAIVLAQIGEFSVLLATAGKGLGILPGRPGHQHAHR